MNSRAAASVFDSGGETMRAPRALHSAWSASTSCLLSRLRPDDDRAGVAVALRGRRRVVRSRRQWPLEMPADSDTPLFVAPVDVEAEEARA